ncbi:MAG: hypothetical protein J7604_09430 [Sporocytophaga sp.]|uniref:hypothetical protein n=1 Tax=Sporocytophaga sp. TaxID=2231183 RepID=UPI001B0582FF|nr:hypothetical protein [Sporocytophaga sp.]MBO9700416.1 hypothetical protein [Sporocytophaga sp.]
MEISLLKILLLTTFILALPVFLLLIFILDQVYFNQTEVLFWALFLLSMLPCGILGGFLGYTLFLKAKKVKSELGESAGIFVILCSVIYSIGGVLGLMLIYIVTS